MINKIRAFVANAKASLEYRSSVNQTIKELHELTDKELWDIGITRGEIFDIATSSYTKPKKVKADDFVVEANPNLKGFV
jgi:uncharacterized protein YjiS (DUF1127 family)